MSIQTTMEETNDTYKAFVEKFKPKKTTDDCYTPDNVYNAIRDWVCTTYNIDPATVVRPFYPGGDYERYTYPEGCLVLDNPPFSILSQIVKFYLENNIRFFMFAPSLTNFAGGYDCCHIITGSGITYENGAQVETAFLTSLDNRLVVGCPELGQVIKEQNDINTKRANPIPKYIYPSCVLTSAMVGYWAKHGVPYELDRKDALFIHALDSQRHAKKTIFGGGYLLSEKATAEKMTAEKMTAEKTTAQVWDLSEREREIIKYLGE